jgi:hypothetical protein
MQPGDSGEGPTPKMPESKTPVSEMPEWPDRDAMDFSNSLTTTTVDEIGGAGHDDASYTSEVDDESWAPPHPAVLSVQIAMSLQSPYPSQTRSAISQAWLSVAVVDPDMVNEQARRRKPFEEAAAAKNGIDDDDDSASNQRSGKSKRSREDEAIQGDEWACSKCETSNDGMVSQCTNCGIGMGQCCFCTVV